MQHEWQRLTEDGRVRSLKYRWGPASSNALAILLPEQGWLLVGCPLQATDAVVLDLLRDGDVIALLAPNAYHYLGQTAWRARFPTAKAYAPRGALARLARKLPELSFRDVAELAALLPGDVAVVEPSGQKSPDLLLRARSGGQTVWWLGDLFSNTGVGDAVWWLRLLSRMAGSGPGYRINTRPELVYVNDRTQWLESVQEALLREPPGVVVPAHGEPVTQGAARVTAALVAQQLRAG